MTTTLEPTTDEPTPAAPPRRLSIRTSTAVTAVAVAGSLTAAGVFAALWISADRTLSERDRAAADSAHAQEVATTYALGASTIDYRDSKAWLAKLKEGVTPQLGAKFDATAPQLEQILLPLQWTSAATPIDAVVASASEGIYKVNVFLDVNSTSAQNPQGGRTTVTYNLTLDQHANWQVTEVGGLTGALPGGQR